MVLFLINPHEIIVKCTVLKAKTSYSTLEMPFAISLKFQSKLDHIVKL